MIEHFCIIEWNDDIGWMSDSQNDTRDSIKEEIQLVLDVKEGRDRHSLRRTFNSQRNWRREELPMPIKYDNDLRGH